VTVSKCPFLAFGSRSSAWALWQGDTHPTYT